MYVWNIQSGQLVSKLKLPDEIHGYELINKTHFIYYNTMERSAGSGMSPNKVTSIYSVDFSGPQLVSTCLLSQIGGLASIDLLDDQYVLVDIGDLGSYDGFGIKYVLDLRQGKVINQFPAKIKKPKDSYTGHYDSTLSIGL